MGCLIIEAAKLLKKILLIGKNAFFLCHIVFYLYFCSENMTEYNPHMTIHKLFLNIKKRDIYLFA